MYSNDQTQIRAGLVNYIGAMLQSSKFDNEKAVRHSVVAILLEEAAKLCKDEEGTYEMFISKPILRLTSGIAKQRYNVLSSLDGKTPEMVALMEKYSTIVEFLDEIIKNTKA